MVPSQCPTPWGSRRSHLRSRRSSLSPGTCGHHYRGVRDPGAPPEVRLRDPRHPRRLRARPDHRRGDPADLRHQSTYKQDGVGGLRGGYEYSRSANPTRTALEGAWRRSRRASGGSRSPAAWPPRTRSCAPLTEPGRPRGHPRRRVRRHVPALRQGRASAGASTTRRPRLRPRRGPRPPSARAPPSWSGSRRRPTRCSASPTSRRWPRSPTTPARCSSSTTPSPRRTSSSRSPSAPTSSSTPRPSTSAGTATWSAAPSWSATSTWPRRSPSTRTPWARSPGRSTASSPCAASRRSASGWTGTATTPSGSSSSSPAHPQGRRRSTTPACPTTRATRSRRGR